MKSVESQAQHAPAAGAVQHDRLHERRVFGRRLAGARDAHRRGPLHGRVHLLPAHGQHRLPEVAAGARAAAVSIAQVDAFKEAAPIAAEARARADARQEGDDRPPADLPDAGARPDACCPTTATARSTSSSCAGSSRRSPTRPSRSRRAPTSRPASETYFVRGNVLVEPGFLAVYPLRRARRTRRSRRSRRARSSRLRRRVGCRTALRTKPQSPRRTRGSTRKETQPPSRIGQGKLIEMMEERGLGTKATRHDIIQKLYDRGYIQNNPIEPSETGIAMVKAFQQYAKRIATPDMTAELEADMDKIAAGETDQGRGRPRSRARCCTSPTTSMDEHKRGARQDHLGGHGPGPDPRAVPEVPRGRARERGGRRPTGSRSSARRSRASASSAARATPTATRPTASRSAAT